MRAEGWAWLLAFLRRFRFYVGPYELDPTVFFDFLEVLAIAAWAAQLVFTGLLLRLSWELRWYMVGERALRIREGLWSLREQTMTIANIQNMTVRQGPIQRLFGIADLEIQTAGGGGSGSENGSSGEGEKRFHVGRFRGLEDAHALRDRIRALLVLRKGAGLGDADDPEDALGSGGEEAAGDLLAGAEALLEEARSLRAALGPDPGLDSAGPGAGEAR